MTYLLSRLTTESPTKDSNQILCYYINDTNCAQIIRSMSGVRCHFESIVFSEERILFEASPESHLEIYSPRINGVRSSKIDCKSLCINEKSSLENSLT